MAVPGNKQESNLIFTWKINNPISIQLVMVLKSVYISGLSTFDNDNLEENQLQSCIDFITDPSYYCTDNKLFY